MYTPYYTILEYMLYPPIYIYIHVYTILYHIRLYVVPPYIYTYMYTPYYTILDYMLFYPYGMFDELFYTYGMNLHHDRPVAMHGQGSKVPKDQEKSRRFFFHGEKPWTREEPWKTIGTTMDNRWETMENLGLKGTPWKIMEQPPKAKCSDRSDWW